MSRNESALEPVDHFLIWPMHKRVKPALVFASWVSLVAAMCIFNNWPAGALALVLAHQAFDRNRIEWESACQAARVDPKTCMPLHSSTSSLERAAAEEKWFVGEFEE